MIHHFSLLWYLPVQFFAHLIHLCKSLHYSAFFLELQILSVQFQRCHRVLDGVVSDSLDVDLEEVPS